MLSLTVTVDYNNAGPRYGIRVVIILTFLKVILASLSFIMHSMVCEQFNE